MLSEVKITINAQQIEHFTGFSFTRSIDHVGDSFTFKCPFFPNTLAYRTLFKPFTYQIVRIFIANKLQFTGRIEKVTPQLEESKTVIEVEGRSLTGVLNDVNFEKAVFPIQFTGAKLDEIAAKVLTPFDFKPVFLTDPGALFEEAGPESPNEFIFDFLYNLTRQRRILMSQTVEGNLLFRKAVTAAPPVAKLNEGQQGLLISKGVYDSTKRFSSFDLFGQEPGLNDNYARVTDPTITTTYRPKSAIANDTNAGNILESAQWLASTSIAEAIDIPISIEGWFKQGGALWVENEIIQLKAPSIMIYNPFTFLIKSVRFYQNATQDMTALNVTLPGAYSCEAPKAYPWL